MFKSAFKRLTPWYGGLVVAREGKKWPLTDHSKWSSPKQCVKSREDISGEIMWNNILCFIDGLPFSEPVSALVHQQTRLPTSTIRNTNYYIQNQHLGNWTKQQLIEWTVPKRQSLSGKEKLKTFCIFISMVIPLPKTHQYYVGVSQN